MPALLINMSIGRALGGQLLAQCRDACQRRQVQMPDGQLGGRRRPAYLTERGFALGPAANRQDDISARGRQPFRQAESQAAIGSGHDRVPAGQVRHVEDQMGLHHVTGSSYTP
jgi:hypothetical protein